MQVHEHFHLDAPRDGAQRHLEATLARMCRQYADMAYPPFGPEDLIAAANGCLAADTGQGDRFVGGAQACAMELLNRNPGGLLYNLALEHGFLVTYLQLGTCNLCGIAFRQVKIFVKTNIVSFSRCSHPLSFPSLSPTTLLRRRL